MARRTNEELRALVKPYDFTSDQDREAASRAGKKGAEVKKQRKNLVTALRTLMEQEFTNKQGEKASGYEVVAMGFFKKLKDGDPKAVKLMAELLGEYKQNIEVTDTTPRVNLVVDSQKTAKAVSDILTKAATKTEE